MGKGGEETDTLNIKHIIGASVRVTCVAALAVALSGAAVAADDSIDLRSSEPTGPKTSPVITVPDDVAWETGAAGIVTAWALNPEQTETYRNAIAEYEQIDNPSDELAAAYELLGNATSTEEAVAAVDKLNDLLYDRWTQTLANAGVEVGTDGWVNPLTVGTFTSGYGARAPVTTAEGTTGTFHDGVDLSASLGTPIRAANDGTVIVAQNGWRGHSGWVIVIDHGDGIWTSYNHMTASDAYVTVGDTVEAGDIIAGVGNEGRSTGPHLHLSVWVDGETVNPKTFFANRSISL